MKLLKRAKPHEVTARTVLLLPPAFRLAAIKALQETPMQQQTIKMARDRYIWPGMGRDIKKFVKSCPVCQRVKINKHEHVKPGRFPTEKTQIKTVHIDLVGLLPESSGFRYILTAIDRASPPATR